MSSLAAAETADDAELAEDEPYGEPVDYLVLSGQHTFDVSIITDGRYLLETRGDGTSKGETGVIMANLVAVTAP